MMIGVTAARQFHRQGSGVGLRGRSGEGEGISAGHRGRGSEAIPEPGSLRSRSGRPASPVLEVLLGVNGGSVPGGRDGLAVGCHGPACHTASDGAFVHHQPVDVLISVLLVLDRPPEPLAVEEQGIAWVEGAVFGAHFLKGHFLAAPEEMKSGGWGGGDGDAGSDQAFVGQLVETIGQDADAPGGVREGVDG